MGGGHSGRCRRHHRSRLTAPVGATPAGPPSRSSPAVRSSGPSRSPSSGRSPGSAAGAGSCSAPAARGRTPAPPPGSAGRAGSRGMTQARISSPYRLVRHAHHLDVGDLRMGVEELLDLPRVDVLAAADDHVLDAADDLDVAVLAHHREVTGVHPAPRVDRPPRSSRARPSSRASRCSRGCTARPPRRAAGSRPSTGSTTFTSMCGRTRPTVPVRRSRSSSRRVWVETGRGLRHAVADGHLLHVHLGDDPLHHLDRAG